jgi:hypothetical protein
MKCCAATLTVFACTALSGVWAFGQASAPSAPAQKARPSFQAAGPRSATAPSGYSDGVTQQRAQATGKLIPLLQRQALLQLLPQKSEPGCAQQEALRSAAARKPRDLPANLNLGWFNLWHGQPAQALAPLHAAGRIAPADVRPKIALTIAYIETEDETQAQQTLDALQAMHANKIVTAQLSAALPSETASTAGTPMSAEVAYTKGLAMLSSGDATQAQRIFAAGLALPAVKPGARADLSLGMGLADALRGTPQQAAAELLDASESDPHNLVSSTLLAAWIAPDAPSAPQALVVIKQTAQLLPGSAIARYNLATLMARMTRQGRSTEQAAVIRRRQSIPVWPQHILASGNLNRKIGTRHKRLPRCGRQTSWSRA